MSLQPIALSLLQKKCGNHVHVLFVGMVKRIVDLEPTDHLELAARPYWPHKSAFLRQEPMEAASDFL